MTLARETRIRFMREITDGAVVLIDNVRLSPERSLAVRDHSPTGFEWGYGGSGPAQTALAILLEAGLSDDRATELYQAFKRDVISGLGYHDEISGADVLDWIAAQ